MLIARSAAAARIRAISLQHLACPLQDVAGAVIAGRTFVLGWHHCRVRIKKAKLDRRLVRILGRAAIPMRILRRRKIRHMFRLQVGRRTLGRIVRHGNILGSCGRLDRQRFRSSALLAGSNSHCRRVRNRRDGRGRICGIPALHNVQERIRWAGRFFRVIMLLLFCCNILP